MHLKTLDGFLERDVRARETIKVSEKSQKYVGESWLLGEAAPFFSVTLSLSDRRAVTVAGVLWSCV